MTRTAPILLLLAVTLLGAGCSVSGVDGWTDIGDLSPRQAVAFSENEEGPASFGPVELAVGKGRVVQHGRRITMRIEVLGDRDEVVGRGDLTFLYPPLDPGRLGGVPCLVASGEVPPYFFPCVAGMRVGGVRRVVLPRTSAPPDTSLRRFVDAASGAVIAEVPADRDVALRVTALAVRRPTIVVRTTYSVPASRDRRVVELWSR